MAVLRGRPGKNPAVALLRKQGVTAAQLAGEMGVAASSAANYLSGRRTPPAGFRPALNRLVGERKAREIVKAIGS